MPAFIFTVLSVVAGDQVGDAMALVVPRTPVSELGAASVPFLGFLVVSFFVSRLIAKLSQAPV